MRLENESGGRENGDDLLGLSMRNLVLKYTEIPLSSTNPRLNIEPVTMQRLDQLDEKLIGQFEALEAGEMNAEDAEDELSRDLDWVKLGSEIDPSEVEYISLFNRGLIWQAEARYWANLMRSDPISVHEYMPAYKADLEWATRLFLSAAIVLGQRIESVNEAMISSLKYLGHSEEAEIIKEASIPEVRRGEHGRRNARLN